MDPGPRGAVTGADPTSGSSRRPRPRSQRSGALSARGWLLTAIAVLATAAGAQAQVPDTLRPPPDTARRAPVPHETLPRLPAQDTLEADTVEADTLLPPPTLPPIRPAVPASWATGVWEWDREDLLRLPDLTLLHLLERIPGLTPVRAGIAGQPETATVFGSTAGAIRYVFDGFELDPLIAPTFDASRIALLSLESVRVERRVTGATVYLKTLTPTRPSPHSVVEAATGDLDVNLFRGTFLAPRVAGGSLGLGFERLATDVLGGSNFLSGWVKWTAVRDSSGVQVELRQTDLDRSGVGPVLAGASRRDWVVRGRTRWGPVVAEGYAGGTSVEDELEDLTLREGSTQGGIRLGASTERFLPLHATAALRLRSHPRLPGQELEVTAWALPRPWLGVGGEVVQGWWDQEEPTGRWTARARVGPLAGLTAFAEVHQGGSTPAGTGPELVVPGFSPAETLRLDRSGARVGVEAGWRGITAGVAALRTEADPVTGFGLPFDSTAPTFGTAEATGIEAVVRVPILWQPLRLEGWYVGLEQEGPWPYLPEQHWRGALVYHHSPLPSGNLEIYSRLEHEFRGGTVAPVTTETGVVLADVPQYRATNFELVIRVLTVRAFLRWENLLHRLGQRDLPATDYFLPGQHIWYGVKWVFWN